MPPEEEEDFESDWRILRPAPDPSVTNPLPINSLAAIMERASKQTLAELKLSGEGVTYNRETLPALVARGIETYWRHMTTGLERVDIVGLLEIILSAQRLPVTELKTFLRALPRTLLDRILASNFGAVVDGIHALLAIEVLVRDGKENDYQLTSINDGGIEIRLQPRKLGATAEPLVFRLDEHFHLQVGAAPPDVAVLNDP